MKKVLLSIAGSLLAFCGFSQMNGTYTINGAQATGGTNYQTFPAAISALYSNGVNGPVTFNVIQGTYANQMLNFTSPITGSSTTNTITFQSAAANTAMPVVNNSSYVFNMGYATNPSNISFKDLRFENTGSSYVMYTYEATYTNWLFEGCEFYQPNTSYYINYGYYSKPTNVTFDECLFDGGYYSHLLYYLDGGSSLNFTNNDFVNFYYMGVYAYSYSPYCVWNFTDNFMESSTTNSSTYTLYMYYPGAGSVFDRNKFIGHGTSYSYNAIFYYPQGNSSQPVMIRNNVFSSPDVNTTYSQYGARIYYSYYTRFEHNTVITKNSYTGTYSAYPYYSSYNGNTFRNNIIHCGAASYNVYTYYINNSYSTWSNNAYYRENGTMYLYNGYSGGTYTDIAAWQSASATDANSVVENADFTSLANPIPQNADIDNMGTPLGVTVDINGNPRSATTPDVGAYEFSVPQNNAQPTSLITPDAPLCDNDTAIVTVVKNTGLVNLTTLNLNYSINNGTATVVSWTGNLAPGALDTVTVTSSINFSNGDNLRFWTSLPNGTLDSSAAFDTLEVDLFSGMSGTFSIPNDYATFAAAAADLVLRGVCDDVVINVSPGTYTESVTFGNIAGTSEDATITFQSTTGNAGDVVLTNSSGYTVNFNGGDWITFQNLSMRNTSGNVVTLTNRSDNITIDNCWLKGAQGTSTTTQALIYRTTMTDNLTITNNRMEKGCGYFYSSIGSTAAKSKGLYMNNNIMEDMHYYYGVLVYYQEDFEFNYNVMKNDSGSAYGYNYYGMYLQYLDKFNITHNYITGEAAFLYYGIYMGNSTGRNNPRTEISNNCVMAGNDNVTSGYYPFYCYSSGIFNLHNNSFTANGFSNYYACAMDNGGLIDIQNNNFANLAGGYALYVYGGFTVSNSDYNNLYTTSGSPIYYGNTAYSTLEQYQNTTGFDMHSIQTAPGYINSHLCVTCNEDLNNAGTPLANITDDIEGNTRSVLHPDLGAVEYVTPASFDLGPNDTICGSEVILEAGPAQSVSWNINGQSYSTESVTLSTGGQPITFNVFVNIATEFCGTGSDQVTVRLVPNAELDATAHLCADEDLTLQPGGSSSASYIWSTGDQTPTITVNEAGTYTVVKNEEGCESEATIAVTQSQAVEISDVEACAEDMPVTLDATIIDGTSYAWSGGTSITSAQNTFNDGGSYSVTATDSWGCSSEDNFNLVVLEDPVASLGNTHSGLTYFFDATGSLYISSNTSFFWDFGFNGMTATTPTAVVTYPWAPPGNLASYTVSLTIDNGCGSDVEVLSITPDPVGVEDIEAGSFALYPNPANDVVKFMLGSAAADQGVIEILDIAGRVVASQTINAGLTQGEINISSLASGSYMVKISIDGAAAVNTLVKQ